MELSYTAAPSWWSRLRSALAIWNRPRAWLAFSIVFGVVAPLVCFGTAMSLQLFGGPELGPFTLACDAYAVFAATTMACWLALRGKSKRFDAFASGVFFFGALFSIPFALVYGALGGVLLLGALFILDPGVIALACLGLAPVASLVVYGINAHRAAPQTAEVFPRQALGFIASLGTFTAIAWFVVFRAEAVEHAVLHTDRPLEELHLERWRYCAPGYEWPELHRAFARDDASQSTTDARDRRLRVASAFLSLTGGNIDFAD